MNPSIYAARFVRSDQYRRAHGLVRLSRNGSVIFSDTEGGAGAKEHLVTLLLADLARRDPFLAASGCREPLTLKKDALGKPRLFLGMKMGPSISFSHGRGRIWGALCVGRGVGIDVAFPEEFKGAYPLARAFRPGEFNMAKGLCSNDPSRAGALLWSLKEAAVKAMGLGFHHFDPLDIGIGPPLFREGGFLFSVRTGRCLPTWARREGDGWLSISRVT